uniref:WbuC family cupin fold metalloprotein n=1 Tax=Escherichia coli TaxID=562 RepID=UPI0013B01E3B
MNQSYGRLVSRAAIAATAMASLLLLIKIFAWWYTGSVSILAALVDSLVDIGASLTNLLVVRYSLQPADDNHSFGHGKAESLAALAQSMFISGSALFLFLTGIQHLVSPTPMTDPGVGVIVTIVALICTIILVSFQRWVVRRTQSQAVRADMLPGTYVRPHRHPHTFELLLPLRGRFVVLNFDDRGTVTHRAILG